MNFVNILMALIWFALLGGILGVLLAIAAKLFAVKIDERTEKITEVLPGANCGGCGYAGCAALADAIVKGKAKTNACSAGGSVTTDKISEIMGVKAEKTLRMRAQVMCSGTAEYAKKKYLYEGARDCISASRLGGGDKICPNGCIGLGTCVAACKFGAITIKDGVASVDYDKCVGCGTCVSNCPKSVIRLIPYDSTTWIGCISADKGSITRQYCDTGCIGCGICQKICEADAITIINSVASINYEKCTGCGKCAAKCPRKIIRLH